MPRLEVKRVGTVAFPVQPAQVRALIEVAERAPYGKGPSTVLDTSVRNCWQIDSAAIRLGGQGWTVAFTTIMEQVSGGLGCPSERLEARPYKLLVYEPGGFFTPHRDTEKEVGMVGTLVVALPTEGAGGELVVRHKDREQVIDMCVSDPSLLAYAAFYADCTHETRALRKGHRVALVFNLILREPGNSALKAGTQTQQGDSLHPESSSRVQDRRERGIANPGRSCQSETQQPACLRARGPGFPRLSSFSLRLSQERHFRGHAPAEANSHWGRSSSECQIQPQHWRAQVVEGEANPAG